MHGILLTTALFAVGAKGPAKPTAPAAAKAPTKAEVVAMLQRVEHEMNSPGDYQAMVYIEEKVKGQEDRISQLVVYRRDADDKLIIFMTKPKTRAGQGYLRIDQNLWYYEPSTGKWERRTDSDRIVGNAVRADFDKWTLSKDFDPVYVATEKIGAYTAYKLDLHPRAGNAASSYMNLWLDVTSGHPLKAETRAMSGDLMRSTYYPKWVEATSSSLNAKIRYFKDVRLYNEVGKSETVVLIQKVTLAPLEANIFTKAWLESQSR